MAFCGGVSAGGGVGSAAFTGRFGAGAGGLGLEAFSRNCFRSSRVRTRRALRLRRAMAARDFSPLRRDIGRRNLPHVQFVEIVNLIESVARGDLSSFEQLYDRYSGTLFALLLRILGNVEDARETLQDAFVQAWGSADRYDPKRGSEGAWLISIARSRGIDRLRARNVRFQRESEAGREISIQTGNVVKAEGGASVWKSEQQRAIRGALAALPEAQRVALELAYFEGLSQSEIAQRLNEPLGTIKTRMLLGMKKLREGLKEMR